MNTDDLIAIDVHVHLETELDDNEANDAAKKYFGDSGVGRNRYELAEYYRSRKIGCVIFTVDERLTGRPPIPNDEIAAFAAENADIMFAFASVDPTRGQEAVYEAKRLIATGGKCAAVVRANVIAFANADSTCSIVLIRYSGRPTTRFSGTARTHWVLSELLLRRLRCNL